MNYNYNYNYNYTKIFFRRPVNTELNILFFRSLLISSVVVFSLTILSMSYFHSYPTYKIKKQVKKAYFARVIEYYEALNPSDINPEGAGSFEPGGSTFAAGQNFSDLAYGIETLPDTELPEIAETEFPYQTLPVDNNLIAFLKSSEESGLSVRSAIDEINVLIVPTPSTQRSPIQAYNTRRKAYESSIRQIGRPQEVGQIAIPRPEFTDFEIVKGIRNHEVIISIAKENEKTVKHCIERIARNNPTFNGILIVRFTIHPQGHVLPESVRIIDSDIVDMRIKRCIVRNIRRWKNFPPVSAEKGEYTMTQKYIF